MIDGFEITDGHMHVFSRKTYERFELAAQSKDERFRKAYATWMEWFKKKYNSPLVELNDDPPETIAENWREELDRHHVDKALFIALHPDEEEIVDFCTARQGEFYYFTTVDPLDTGSPALLNDRVRNRGCKGLKLYPTTGEYLPSDKRLYPLYEEAASLHIPVMFHLGITLQYESDLRYANPIALHPVLKDFPGLNIIIPHFGAGYFQEVLFLVYHVQNLYIDTSGTNRWTEYVAYSTTLEEVFRRTLNTAGPERLIYGTDSRVLRQGYRQAVLHDQYEILKKMDLSREELEMILGGNIKRITGIG